MKGFEAERDEFVDKLFALALEENFASVILPHLAGVMGVPSSNVAGLDTATSSYTQDIFGIDKELLERRGAHFFPLNPWVRAGFAESAQNPAAYAAPTIRTGAQLVPYRTYRETEYYRDFNRFTGVGDDMLAMFFPFDHRVVAFAVSVGGRLFDDADRERAASLLKDLSRALRLHMRVAIRGANGFGLGFQGASAASIITTIDDVLADANPPGRALLDAGSPVKLLRERVVFADSNANEAFREMRRAAAAPTRVCIVQHGAERWVIQFVKRAKVHLLELMKVEEPVISIVVTPLNSAAAARRRSLEGFTELTLTEREVLGHLINGLDVPAIASRTGRGRETIRTHIASLRQKLGAHSMVDLARIGALLLPV